MAAALLQEDLSRLSINEGWNRPEDPVWADSDGPEIRLFYKKRVRVEQNEWFINCGHVDFLLNFFFANLKEETASYPGIILKEPIRQGSSREGLKVSAADEFDTVVPFEFDGIETKVLVKKEPQFTPLPPGYAQIELVRVSDDFRKKYPKLITMLDKKEMLNTKYLHDSIFQGMVDKMLSKIQTKIEEVNRKKRTVTYKINRKSSAPAIILETIITEKNGAGESSVKTISIDFVPGYVYDYEIGKPKLLISKWIPESKRVAMKTPITDAEKTATTIWKLSFYEKEVDFIDRRKQDPISKFFIAAFRILKGLRKADTDRDKSSQFASVFSSYYMKNILMYALLFEPKIRAKHTISSVTEALGCLIAMIKLVLDEKNLPKFFISNPLLKEIYPNEDFHKGNANTRMNIISEYKDSLEQVKRDFELAIKYFKLDDLSDSLKANALLKYFKAHLSAV